MLTVRPMRAAERDDVRALLTEAYLPYEKEMAPTVFAKYLASVLDTDENQTLVAVEGHEVLGSARLYLPGTVPLAERGPVEWTDPMPADWAWVRSVGVRPAARGTGVARALMAHVASAAGDATAVLLHTMDFMPAAIRLYERLGYRRAPEWDFRAAGPWRRRRARRSSPRPTGSPSGGGVDRRVWSGQPCVARPDPNDGGRHDHTPAARGVRSDR